MSTRALALALAGLLLLAACSTVPITGRSQLSMVPQADIVVSAAQGYDELIAESELSSDSEMTRMVVDVGTDVARSAEAFLRDVGMEDELRYYEWEFNLIQDDEMPNAFCLPGGKIGVYTGIMPVAGGPDGLAVVISHEVAHAIANHGGERMSQLLLAELGGMALATAMESKPDETRELAMLAYGLGAQLGVLLPYSRQHESEADRIGLILMARAGYDPHEAVPFWQRMNQLGGGRPPEFLSTHPAPETRIEQIQEYLPEALEYYDG
jgi:predicted Zn-dependent protease